jgi:hypothetical protein
VDVPLVSESRNLVYSRLFLENFKFKLRTSRSEPRSKIYLKLHNEATRKDSDPKKAPRASFDLLNLCPEFHDHFSTGSTSIREAKFWVRSIGVSFYSWNYIFLTKKKFWVGTDPSKFGSKIGFASLQISRKVW